MYVVALGVSALVFQSFGLGGRKYNQPVRVTGNVTVDDTVDVKGDVQVSGSVHVDNTVEVTGNVGLDETTLTGFEA